MTKAVVIKTHGDQEIAGAIVDGMIRRNLPVAGGEHAIIHGEYERLRIQPLRREGAGKPSKTPRRERIRKYTSRPHGRVYNAVLGVYGLVVWCVVSAVNMGLRGRR